MSKVAFYKSDVDYNKSLQVWKYVCSRVVIVHSGNYFCVDVGKIASISGFHTAVAASWRIMPKLFNDLLQIVIYNTNKRKTHYSLGVDNLECFTSIR